MHWGLQTANACFFLIHNTIFYWVIYGLIAIDGYREHLQTIRDYLRDSLIRNFKLGLQHKFTEPLYRINFFRVWSLYFQMKRIYMEYVLKNALDIFSGRLRFFWDLIWLQLLIMDKLIAKILTEIQFENIIPTFFSVLYIQ